jgi:hypothetical protein
MRTHAYIPSSILSLDLLQIKKMLNLYCIHGLWSFDNGPKYFNDGNLVKPGDIYISDLWSIDPSGF